MADSRIGENRLLKSLGAGDLSQLRPHLKQVPMPLGRVLHEPDEPIEHIYFPLSGMVSFLTVMKSGEQIETAIVGREGVVGASIGGNGANSAGQTMVQIAGAAMRTDRPAFLSAYRSAVSFRTLINKFQHTILLQAQQSAACHALHSVEARLCRWLLQSRDTTQSDTVNLTQEFLSHMLGVRRTSVSMCAHALQKTGVIKYARGKIIILNRQGLTECACECYEAVRGYIDEAVPPLR